MVAFAPLPVLSQVKGPKINRLQKVTIKKGDTLRGIAAEFLRDPKRWEEILMYNPQLSRDSARPLPGKTLRIPVDLIKNDKVASILIEKVNKVLYRRRDTSRWRAALPDMLLYENDYLRTMKRSRALIRFIEGEPLSIGPSSMVTLKPINKAHDVELKRGEIFATRARIVTPTATIIPQGTNTKYLATVGDDLRTVVQVDKGRVLVKAEGKTVGVSEGMKTEIQVGKAPAPPKIIPDLPAFRARMAKFHSPKALYARAKIVFPSGGSSPPVPVSGVKARIQNIAIGTPVSGYRIQLSLRRDFSAILIDKTFPVEDEISFSGSGLAEGYYWGRTAIIDLMGFQKEFGKPISYSLKNGKLIRFSRHNK